VANERRRPQRIVAATDFSPEAQLAVQRAALLAKALGVPGTLVHVLPAMLPAEFLPAATQQARRALADALEALEAQGAPFSSRLLTGAVAAQLIDAASPGDLLVAGTREWDAVLHLALGRTSGTIAAEARGPALIVKHAADKPYRRILAAVDLSPGSRGVMEMAMAIGPDAHVELFHSFEVEYESTMQRTGVTVSVIEDYRRSKRSASMKALDELASASPSARERISAHAMRGDPRWTILEHAAGANDLIVLGRRSIGVVERFLVGSVASHILERAACDVLVVPPEAA